MTGLVGLALVAPGVAAAQEVPAVCAAGTTLDPSTNTCVADPSPSTVTAPAEPAPEAPAAGTTTPDTGSTSGTSTGSSDETSGGTSSEGRSSSGGSTGSEGRTPAANDAGPAGQAPAGGPAAAASGTGSTTPEATAPAPAAAASTPSGVKPGEDAKKVTEDGVAAVNESVKAQAPGAAAPLAVLPPTVLQDAFDSAFGDGFVIPTTVPTGGFTNPQSACAFLAGQTAVPAGTTQEAFAGQLAGFCRSLPTSFTGIGGLTDLTRLIAAFTNLLNGLLPVYGGGYVPAYYGARDLDCGDFATQEQAQSFLGGFGGLGFFGGLPFGGLFGSGTATGYDPFNLDADNDGRACENLPSAYDRGYANGFDDGLASARPLSGVAYTGYPQGGVATGDGSTGGNGLLGVAALALALTLAAALANHPATAARRERDTVGSGV